MFGYLTTLAIDVVVEQLGEFSSSLVPEKSKCQLIRRKKLVGELLHVYLLCW